MTDDKREIYFAYNFAPPKTETVHEEYLIYDAIGLIGSVGGTLGMFIGFSFSNTIGTLMKHIEVLSKKHFWCSINHESIIIEFGIQN